MKTKNNARMVVLPNSNIFKIEKIIPENKVKPNTELFIVVLDMTYKR